MVTEAGVARGINAVMFSLLGGIFAAFAVWMAVAEFPHVRQIYLSLSVQQHGQLGRFLFGAAYSITAVIYAVRFLSNWIGGRTRRPVATP